MGCNHCNNSWLDRGDLECVNGVLIDIDEATEGWQRDVLYPPAPCMACEKCKGAGENSDGQECRLCRGNGWKHGLNESQERLAAWSRP